MPFSLYFPCSWVQLLDNTQDPTHSCFLHTRVSGAQLSESWGELPELDYVETPIGRINVNLRRWKDKLLGAHHRRHPAEPEPDRRAVAQRRGRGNFSRRRPDALAEGDDYKTIERADKVDGVLSTYTRDSVMAIAQSDDNETALRQEFGREISKMVFAAAKIPWTQAREYFAERLADFISTHR